MTIAQQLYGNTPSVVVCISGLLVMGWVLTGAMQLRVLLAILDGDIDGVRDLFRIAVVNMMLGGMLVGILHLFP